jgi:hypothetical protein
MLLKDDGRVVDDVGQPDAVSAIAPDQAPIRKRLTANADLILRIAVLQIIVVVAYIEVFTDVAVAIGQGSRAAYLLVMPVLLTMIAFGRGTAARGVADAETDWILAGSLGGLALLLNYLATQRFPSLAALWNLPLISAVLWSFSVATILFGARRIWQVWPMWLFALVTVTPLPSMLITAGLGGGNAAASAVAAVLGAVAVFLAGRRSALGWRLAAAAVSALAGVGAAIALAERPLPLSVAVSAGVIPVACATLLYRFTGRAAPREGGLAGNEGSGKPTLVRTVHDPAFLPYRSPTALTMLAVLAGLQMVLTAAATGPADLKLARADADWATKAGLSPTAEFGFISRYLGPDSTFTRYLAPQVPGYPAAAVDVITAASLGALQTYRDVIWYPAPVLPDYRIIDLNSHVTNALVLATDSSVTTNAEVADWYAVTWTWNTGSAYQQVYVVVNQTTTPTDPPPPNPAPPSIRDTMITPALWISRQQADPSTKVDPVVAARAQQVADDVVRAAAARSG